MSTVLKTHEIIHKILGIIFEPEYRRLAKWIDILCANNREAYGDPELIGFIYNGEIYKPLAANVPNHAIKRRGLHPTLMSNMDNYLKDLNTLTTDKSFISQSLFKILDPCENNQDIRDALPNCLVDTLPELQGISRGRPEAWSIEGDERATRQYQQMVPKIQMYASARLLF
jgi:hypothetical protein